MINWNMGLAPDVGGMFSQGFQVGQEKARQLKTNNALAAFAKNPQDSMAVNSLLEADPRMGMQAMEQQRAQQKEREVQDLMQRAAGGDHGALLNLAGKNPDLFMKMDRAQLERAKKTTDFLGQVGLDISQTPEPDRPAKWAAYVRQAEASGMDIPTQYETYSPQALNGIVAEAGKAKEFFDLIKVEWKTRPDGGELIPMDAMGRRLDMAQGGPQAMPQSQALSEEEGARILQNAQQTSTISESDAARVRASLGPNGEGRFRNWLQQHSISVAGGQTAAVAPPPGFVMDN